MKIGSVEWKGPAALAPMAGVADRAFRELCVGYGAAYVVSEMVSAKGMTMHDKKSASLLSLSEQERPAAVQLFGSEPETMAEAAVMALAFTPDVLDINMGCPAPKITGGRGGASLMKQPELAEKIIRAVQKAVPLPVTVKLRAGWDEDHINAVELARRAEAAGAAAVTIHGRTRRQMYAPPVDPGIIRRVKQAVSIPVIGNGDITDGPSAARMLEETGCDGIMVGRGALGRPWVFQQINAWLLHGVLLPDPPVSERMAVMVRHIQLLCAYKGDFVGMREARKHAGWYMKGIRGAAGYRRRIGALETMEQLQQLAYEITKESADSSRQPSPRNKY